MGSGWLGGGSRAGCCHRLLRRPMEDAAARSVAGWRRLEDAILEPLLCSTPPAFGAEARRSLFAGLGGSAVLGLEPTEHYLNQGGTGAVIQAVAQLKELAGRLAEEQPMSYHRVIGPALMRRAREAAAAYLGASPESLSFVASASAGFYAVLRALSLEAGDILLTSSVRYHSFDDDLQQFAQERGVIIRTVDLPLPITSTAQILRGFEAAFAEAAADGSLGRIRLAFFDHVSSKPTVLFPVDELCQLCRERGVPSLVDGAHCPGLLAWAGEAGPSDSVEGARLDAMQPDFYVANFYKWA